MTKQPIECGKTYDGSECYAGGCCETYDTPPHNTLTLADFERAREMLIRHNMKDDFITIIPTFDAGESLHPGFMWLTPEHVKTNTDKLGNCTAATPSKIDPVYPDWSLKQIQEQQGNNPMRFETNSVNASASISAIKSDESIQREYLLAELSKFDQYSWKNPIRKGLRKLFNLDTMNTPQSALDMIDAIKNGKFKLDDKKAARGKAFADKQKIDGDAEPDYDDECDCEYPSGMFYGLTFDGPVADFAGHATAVKAYEKALVDTKRKIIVGTPAEGLEALTAMESWTYTPAPVTIH